LYVLLCIYKYFYGIIVENMRKYAENMRKWRKTAKNGKKWASRPRRGASRPRREVSIVGQKPERASQLRRRSLAPATPVSIPEPKSRGLFAAATRSCRARDDVAAATVNVAAAKEENLSFKNAGLWT
jgi:hypothetical protein